MRKLFWIVLAVLIAGVAAPAQADTFTYTYTGNDFTTVSGAYTTSDRVTGTFVLSAPIPAGLTSLTDESSLLVSFSLSDGVQTLTGPPLRWRLSYLPPTPPATSWTGM